MHLLERLSKREQQVVENIAWGLTKQEVADKLFISYNTVDSHVKNIYRKMEIRKETDLTRIYFVEHFNIPIGMNPIKQTIVALLLCVLSIFTLFIHTDCIRVRTARASSKTARSGRKGKEEVEGTDYYC